MLSCRCLLLLTNIANHCYTEHVAKLLTDTFYVGVVDSSVQSEPGHHGQGHHVV